MRIKNKAAAFVLAAAFILAGCGTAEISGTEEDFTQTESHKTAEEVEELNDALDEGEYILGAESSSSFKGSGFSYDEELEEGADGILYLSGTEQEYLIGDGCGIQIDDGNEEDFTDPNTVLHADESLNFVRFLDEEFFYENEYIYIAADNKILEYRIFAAYTAENEDILKTRNCYSLSDFYSWLDEIFGLNEIGCVINTSLEEEVMEICRILTIQTGQENGTDIIVQGTYTGKEER